MNIVHRWLLLPVICVSVVFILLRIVWYRSNEQTIRFLDVQHRLFEHTSPLRRIIKVCLYIVALLSLTLVVVRPQWGVQEGVSTTKQRDIFIALDVSRSMLANDVRPSRMAFVQQKLQHLLSVLQGERVGLLFFSTGAYVQAPLTSDQDLIRDFLRQAHHSIGDGTTRLEQVFKELLSQIDEGAYRSNIALIVTDGEDFSRDLSAIKKELAVKGVVLITYGVGTPAGGTITLPDGKGLLLNDDGKPVVTRLNELLLQSLADQTGGLYVSATQDATDIALIRSYIEKQEHQREQESSNIRFIDRYPLFAALSAVSLTIEWII